MLLLRPFFSLRQWGHSLESRSHYGCHYLITGAECRINWSKASSSPSSIQVWPVGRIVICWYMRTPHLNCFSTFTTLCLMLHTCQKVTIHDKSKQVGVAPEFVQNTAVKANYAFCWFSCKNRGYEISALHGIDWGYISFQTDAVLWVSIRVVHGAEAVGLYIVHCTMYNVIVQYNCTK